MSEANFKFEYPAPLLLFKLNYHLNFNFANLSGNPFLKLLIKVGRDF